jgi:glycogen debranching enzyme
MADAAERQSSTVLFSLKDNTQFLVANAVGDCAGASQGLFRDDTRVLSWFALLLGERAPSLLSSGLSRDNVYFRAHLTNRPLPQLGGPATPEGVVHVERARLLWAMRLHERLTLTNYGHTKVPVRLRVEFRADFADIFEVRGHARERRGRIYDAEIGVDHVALRYEGLDGIVRANVIAFSQRPDEISGEAAEFALMLDAHARQVVFIEIGPDRLEAPSRTRFRTAAACARRSMRAKRRRGASIQTGPHPFSVWLEKSRADLDLLTTEFPTGPYPCAGIPWFATPFGRDGIISALQVLWLDPALARGVLRFLAATQASTDSEFQDAAPGKILHETRNGEMAILGEVPFRQYYGSVDSTPLFLMLAGAYAHRTGDMALIDELWPSVRAAMAWLDRQVTDGPNGFVAYSRARPSGLSNQGWKDSNDSIFHANGSLAVGPVALVEVQGYAYAARRALSWLAERRGERELAQEWRLRARDLRAEVERRFWMPAEGYYAVAIDGHGEPCRVRTSNAGQLLYTGLPSQRRGELVIEQLLGAPFADGWGLRTVASDQPRFNPMSYHNGSVWPHDTALCAAGMALYGNKRAAARLLSLLFRASTHFDMRLPELYCGFQRRTGEPPVGYPVACLPQAWSSGAVFMLLCACLGVTIDGFSGVIHVNRPELPVELNRLVVEHLIVGTTTVDLLFERVGDRVTAAPLGPNADAVDVIVRA